MHEKIHDTFCITNQSNHSYKNIAAPHNNYSTLCPNHTVKQKKVSQFHVFYLEYESLYDLFLATRRAMTNITMKKTIINLSVKSFCR